MNGRTTSRLTCSVLTLALSVLLAGLLYPAEITVTTLNDSGAGSLRESITTANGNAGLDSITFAVSGTVLLSSALPELTDDSTVIAGNTAPGGPRSLVIDGNQIDADGLVVNSAHNEIRDVVVNNFGPFRYCIHIRGDSNVVSGSYISVSADGTAFSEWCDGLRVDTADYVTIGGCTTADRNVIGGRFGAIVIYGANDDDNHTIAGNYIGVAANGLDPLTTFDCETGIVIQESNSNTIGGESVDCRNVAGNIVTAGIRVGNSRNTGIFNNYLGLNAPGIGLMELAEGIVLYGTSSHNTVGGPGKGNYIASFVENGIGFGGDVTENTDTNIVRSNIIGLNVLGQATGEMIDAGIRIRGGRHNILGGYDAGEGNIIVGNEAGGTLNGIMLESGYTTRTPDSNVVIGNMVNVDANGDSIGFCSEPFRINGGSYNFIDSNVFAFGMETGVTGPSSVQNTFTRNLVYGYQWMAFDLGLDDITPNDVGDADTGPNDLLNFPEVDSAVSQPDGFYIVYGRAAPKSRVELFVAHPAKDFSRPALANGHGGAYAYIDFATANSIGDFSLLVDSSYHHFSQLTATATDTLGNTSEFAENFVLNPRPLIIVAYSPVNIIVTDPDGLRYGKDSLNFLIEEISPAFYSDPPEDSVVIFIPKAGEYTVQFVKEAGVDPASTYSAIIKTDGTQSVTIAADLQVPAYGEIDTYTYLYEEGYHYVNADANGDDNMNISDAVYIIGHVFKGGPPPDPWLSGDADCNLNVNIADAVVIINHIFKGGPPPCEFTP